MLPSVGEVRLKIVFLVRHAKSSWKDSSLRDKDRPLKKRGARDLKLLRPALTAHEHKPEHVFSSDARRAAETAKTLAAFYGLKKSRVTFTNGLYAASPGEILDFIRNRDDDLRSIMIVGHNPEMSEAADLLGEEPLEVLLPTSAVVCMSFLIDSWEELRENSGHLEFFEYPRKYKQEVPGSTNTSTGS